METIGNTNKIYRASENDISNKELVHSYKISTSHGFNNYLGFQLRDNQLWAYYHVGGAAMGSDVYLKISKDGEIIEKHSGYLDFKYTLNGTLRINQFAPPGPNNLLLIPKGQDYENGKRIGSPNFMYGLYTKTRDDGMSVNYDKSTTIIDNEAYVLTSSYPTEKGELNRIYKINLDTNEMTKITNFEVKNFKIRNNKIYYVKDEDEYLYSSSLDGTNEKRISDNKISWYDEINGNVYYTTFKDYDKYNLYKSEVSKDDTLVLKESIQNVQVSNNKIICKLSDGEHYGIKEFDSDGNLNLAITDKILNNFVHDGKIMIVSAEDKSIKVIK